MMFRTNPRSFVLASLTVVIAVVSALGLAACDRAGAPRTTGQEVDAAVAKAKEAGDRARTATEQAAAGAKSAVNDTAITASVKAELARDSELSALNINVDTSDGRVALRGNAPNATARDRATRLAAAVEGVRSVDNQIAVKGKS